MAVLMAAGDAPHKIVRRVPEKRELLTLNCETPVTIIGLDLRSLVYHKKAHFRSVSGCLCWP